MNEIDRCGLCRGTGHALARHDPDFGGAMKAPGSYAPRTEAERCFMCAGSGCLDPIGSLAQSLEQKTTLAWLATHASTGADPIPSLWDRASMRSRSRLWEAIGNKHFASCFGACTPESQKHNPIPPEEIDWVNRLPLPTIDSVMWIVSGKAGAMREKKDAPVPGAKWSTSAYRDGPDGRKRERHQSDGRSVLDEVTVDNWLHLEQLDPRRWWICIAGLSGRVTIDKNGEASIEFDGATLTRKQP